MTFYQCDKDRHKQKLTLLSLPLTYPQGQGGMGGWFMSFSPNMADPHINDESKGVKIDEVSRPLILEKVLQTEMLL